ncbi:3-oxoacyl-ACP reductase FabG [Dermatophilaceae bacterium Soc4.6]
MTDTPTTVSNPEAAAPQRVLVTGGNRGIGLAIARAMSAQGDEVVITHRSGKPPEGLRGVLCEVTSTDSVNAAFDQAEKILGGPVEVLICNAGITRDGLIMRMSDADFDSVIETNLSGAFKCSRRAVKGMIRARHGRIVFVSSVSGFSGAPGQANYAASKSGLVGMARSIARELGSRGITANVIAPGFIDTDMTAELTDEVRAGYMSSIPMGRFASVEEVTGVVRFLASPDSAYITGAVIPVDGGLGMGH